MSQRLNLAVLSILSLAGVASAQLVTPPTEAPPKTEPLPLPPEDFSRLPAAQQPTPPPTVRPPAPDVIPPDLKWESLVKNDKQGNLIHLNLPPEAAAIAVNPLLNDQGRSLAKEYLAERRRAFENLVIANLDIAEELDSDKLITTNVMNKDELKWLMDARKPFCAPVAPGAISTELAKKGVFSPLQAKVNAKIAKEYADASLKDAIKQAEAHHEGPLTKIEQVPILLREQALGESIGVRRDLMVEASHNLPALITKLGLKGEAAAKVQEVAKSLSATATDAERFAAIEGLKPSLTLDERREMLKATIALRPAGK